MNLRRGGVCLALVWCVVAGPSLPHAQETLTLTDQETDSLPELMQDNPSDTKKKGGFWERLRLGGSLSFYSGIDRIRSHSANVVLFRDIQINPSAIVFEPRVEPSTGRISLSPVLNGDITTLNFSVQSTFIRDPRKDFGAKQDFTLEETLWGVLNAAYDIKTWRYGTLFVQLDSGYYRGDAGSLEVAVDIAEEPILNPQDQDGTAPDPLQNFQFIFPNVGRVTQVPVSLSGLWQFRPRSPFRPYAGVGIGYVFASLGGSASLDEVNRNLAGINYTYRIRGELISQGVLPAETIQSDVEDDYFWTVQGGLEYNVNRNWSIYLDARFIQTDAAVTTRVRTPDGLEFSLFGQGIQRSDSVDDVEGIGSAEVLLQKIQSLSVEEAVKLLDDINEVSTDPIQNEARFFTSFPVELGSEVIIQVPNPINGEPTDNTRQTKLFVQGGNLELDSFSMGVGFRFRY